MNRKLILVLAFFSTASAFAVVDEDSQQNAICYIKANAPELVYGELPFSCDGKAESFVSNVKEQLDFLSRTELVDKLNECTINLFEPKNMTNVARGVWDLKDSPIMHTNAVIASSISDACKIINGSEKISTQENKVNEVSKPVKPRYTIEDWLQNPQEFGTDPQSITEEEHNQCNQYAKIVMGVVKMTQEGVPEGIIRQTLAGSNQLYVNNALKYAYSLNNFPLHMSNQIATQSYGGAFMVCFLENGGEIFKYGKQ
ncbi:hypothetical protein GHO40_19145 [Pseudomonas helleri]|uniref:SCP domain-containing protein n=1 Tax=Pseudomonas helleri TaxID=1608996 RepID=A0A7X1WBK0_9PSED|nr:hypothetical protein [Pseudomonas helleri]MQT48824.1 hypothetical protein [Pseudomonas helleri]